MFNPGFFSKQHCCYYCRAVQWVYESDNPELNNYLYTNFGPTANHRNTTLVGGALETHFCIMFLSYRFKTNRFRTNDDYSQDCHCRLVTLNEWVSVNPQTPLMTIPGWSPWRSLEYANLCVGTYRFGSFPPKSQRVIQLFQLVSFFTGVLGNDPRDSSRHDAYLPSCCLCGRDHFLFIGLVGFTIDILQWIQSREKIDTTV